MNCPEVRDQLDLLATGCLPDPARLMVTAHLDTCAECREALDECREMLAAIRSAAPPESPRPAFVRAVQSAVRGEVRRARHRRWAGRAGRVGAAAAAVLLMGFGVWHWATRVPKGAPAEPARRVADVERWRLEGTTAVPTSSSDDVVVQGPRMYFLRKEATGNRVAAASVTTGQLLWQAPADGYGHLAADPARLYCLARGAGRTVDLVCLEAATGNLLWRYSPGAPPDMDGPCRPLPLAANRVCWTVSQTVHALDAVTGRPVWKWSSPDTGRPSLATAMGGNVYVASAAAIYCLGAESGEQVWRLDFGAGQTARRRPLLAIGGGRAYVACPTPSPMSRLVCVHLGGPRILWTRTIPRPLHLLAAEDVLYVRGSEVLAMDAISGTLRWSRPAAGCSPLTADDGLLHVVDSTDAGRLIALDRHTGRPEWEISGIRSCGAFVPTGDLGLVKTLDGVVHALALHTP